MGLVRRDIQLKRTGTSLQAALSSGGILLVQYHALGKATVCTQCPVIL